MGTGIVFVYLSIAALVAPFAWLAWWGVASVAREPKLVPATAHVRTPPKRSEPAPVPLDLRLVGRYNAITVYGQAGEEVSTCPGPDSGGRCSRPLADGTVPCAGCLLALPRPIRGSFEWQVPAGYRACLVGSYDVFRAPRPAAVRPV